MCQALPGSTQKTNCIVADKASSVSVFVASLEGMVADEVMKPEETALSSFEMFMSTSSPFRCRALGCSLAVVLPPLDISLAPLT